MDSVEADGLWHYWKIFFTVTWPLDPNYWCTKVGFEAYSFMVFQRKIIWVFVAFAVANGILFGLFFLGMNLYEWTVKK